MNNKLSSRRVRSEAWFWVSKLDVSKCRCKFTKRRSGPHHDRSLLIVAAGHLRAEVVMADEDKPRTILVTPPKRVDGPTQPCAHRPKPMPIRSEEELRALALRIAENSELMHRFRAAFGSNDKVLTGRSMHEIREYAQRLDPSVTGHDQNPIWSASTHPLTSAW